MAGGYCRRHNLVSRSDRKKMGSITKFGASTSGVTFEFGEILQEAQLAFGVRPPEVDDLDRRAESIRRFTSLRHTTPRAAILDGWSWVTAELTRLGGSMDIDSDSSSNIRLISQEYQFRSELTISLILLRSLRNAAVHGEGEITPEDARSYFVLSVNVSMELYSIVG